MAAHLGNMASEQKPLLINEDDDFESGNNASEKKTGGKLAGAGTSGSFQAFINTTKAFVGAASFELPGAIMNGGSVGALVGLLGLAVLSRFALLKLADCGRMVPGVSAATYPEVGEAAFGKAGRVAAWFGMLAMTLGVCGAYIVFISTTLGVTPECHAANSCMTNLSASWWTIITCALLIPLSMIKSLKMLAFTSAFGLFALLFAVFVTTADASEVPHDFKEELQEIPAFKWKTYPLFLGNAAFLYLLSTAILPLEQGMAKRNTFATPFTWSMIFVTIMNVLFGYYAYLSYGDCGVHGNLSSSNIGGYGSEPSTNYYLAPLEHHHHNQSKSMPCTQSNVILNLPVSGATSKLVKILLCIDLLFTTIVFLFPFSQAFEIEILDKKSFGTFKTEVKRALIRIFIIVAIAGVGRAVPNFSYLTGLSGGFGNNILAFILPPIFFLKLQQNKAALPADLHLRIHSPNPLVRYGEYFGLGVAFVFGIGLLILSTQQYVQLVKQLSNHTGGNNTSSFDSLADGDFGPISKPQV